MSVVDRSAIETRSQSRSSVPKQTVFPTRTEGCQAQGIRWNGSQYALRLLVPEGPRLERRHLDKTAETRTCKRVSIAERSTTLIHHQRRNPPFHKQPVGIAEMATEIERAGHLRLIRLLV